MAFITAETRSDLIELSVAMLKQAPSAALLEELIALSVGGGSLADAADHIAKTDAFKAEYPSFQTAEQYATEIFDNITTGGTVTAAIRTAVIELATGMLTSGSVTKAGLALAIAEYLAAPAALLNEDFADIAQSFQNRADAAEYFVVTKELGGSTAAELAAAIASVTSDAATLTAANTAADATASAEAVVAGQTFTLTTGVDNVVGGGNSDLILGSVDEATIANNTFSTADVINGGAGTDTLQIAVADVAANTTYTPALITNVEKLRVVNTGDRTITVDTTSISGLTSVELSSSVTATDVDELSSTDISLVAVANTANVDFAFASTALAGDSTAIDLHLTSNSGDVTVNGTGAGIESATITATGTNSGGNYIGLAGDLTSLTVKGTGSLVIDSANDMTSLESLDASENSGGVTYNASATNVALTGGTGNDTLTDGPGADTIMGGAGSDVLTGGAGNDHIDGGAGNDTVILSGVTEDDTVTGGEGVDILALVAGTTYTATESAGTGISGFEVISNALGDLTQNMSGLGENSIATLAIGAVAGTATIQEGAISTVVASNSGTAVLGLATDSAADALTVSVGHSATGSGAKALSLSAQDYETLTVSSTGADENSVTLGTTEAGYLATTAAELLAQAAAWEARTASDLTSITVVGNKNLTVTTSAEDTALATVNASTFTGKALTVAASSSDAAMTVTAAGAYKATITTGDGADSVTVGDGSASGANNITTGKGNDTVVSGLGNDTISGGAGDNNITSGAGNDSITATTGADVIDAGAGNDTISSGDGADSITAGAGHDSITATAGADTIDGGAGNDTISSGAGADSIVGGTGDDSITSGTGSDNVSGGDGNDIINVGTGDDTVAGGEGNDSITIATLTNGDSIDGGAGNDTLTLTAVASTSTPKNISGIETLGVTTLGGGGSSIEVDLTNVSDLTTITATENQTSGSTLTLTDLPSTLTTLNLADAGSADTLAAAYSSGPSALTLNSYALANSATNITSLNAPLTINGKMLTTLAGTAQAYAAGNVTTLGTMSTDATAITIATESLSSGIGLGTDEFTIGAITDNVLESITVNGGAYSDLTISAAGVSTSSAEFSSIDINVGAGGSVDIGKFTATAATKVTIDLSIGAQGSLIFGTNDSTFAEAEVTVIGNIGDQASLTPGDATNDAIIGDDIASSTFTVGNGVGASALSPVLLPDLEVDSTSGTIGAVSITSGIASYVEQTIGGGSKTPKTMGAVTLDGNGYAKVVLGATASATVAATGANTQGNVSAAAMTSSLSSAVIDASAVISDLTITGGAGNDRIIIDATHSPTITGGTGTDVISLSTDGTGNDTSTITFEVGDSNIVQGTLNGNDTGQDTINGFGNDGADIIRVKGTSTDTYWNIADHVLAGNDEGSSSKKDGDFTAFDNETVLVQFGNNESADDPFDIAINVYLDGNDSVTGTAGIGGGSNDAAVQAIVAVDITGTIGADTITTGAQADTISGGSGNDTIDGDGLGDIIDGGAGSDVIDINAATDSKPVNYDQTTLAGIDVITLGTGDTIDLTTFNSSAIADATNDDVVTVTFAEGAAETTWTAIMTKVNAALSNDAHDVNIIRVVDDSTDTNLDGSLSGYYLLANDATAAFGGVGDVVIKLVGVDTGTLWAVSSGEIVSFTL